MMSASGRPTRHQQGTQPVGPRLTAGLQEKFRRTNIFLRYVVGCLKAEQDLVGAGLYVGACSWREPRGDKEREELEQHPEDFADTRSISLKLSMRRLLFSGIEEEEMGKKRDKKEKHQLICPALDDSLHAVLVCKAALAPTRGTFMVFVKWDLAS